MTLFALPAPLQRLAQLTKSTLPELELRLNFAEQVAAITGAGSGIGRELAVILARFGCHLALADINEEQLMQTKDLLVGFDIKVTTTVIDVADAMSMYGWAEEVMSEHPAVKECGAIGIPSDSRGEDPKLFVVKKGEVTEQELLDYGKKQLTGYKRPRHIQFVGDLPKSNIGKILRKELRKMEGLE